MLTQNIREYNMKKKPSFKDRNKNPSKTRTKVSEEESSSREGCLRTSSWFLSQATSPFRFFLLDSCCQSQLAVMIFLVKPCS